METSKILLVDDLPANIAAMENILKPINVSIMKAYSGEETLKLLLRHSFAVILLDVQMPGIDGFETAKLIRHSKNGEYTPIIFVTAIDRDQSRSVEAYGSGAVDYLFKPIDPIHLRSKVKIFLELDEQKNTLQEKKEQLKLSLQASETGIWTLNCINDDFMVDDSTAIILGFQCKEEVPKKYSEFFKQIIHPIDCERVDQDLTKSIKENTTFNTYFRVLLPDKSERVIIARGKLFVDTNNVPIKMTGVFVDITEKEASKKQLERLANDLEVSNRKLENSNERLQEFAYVASHDLQEPLRMVSNFVQLLHKRYKDKLDKDANDYIQFAVSGTERMKTLINDLLSYLALIFKENLLKK